MVSRRPLTGEGRIWSEDSSNEIRGGQGDTGTGYSASTSVFLCVCHSNSAPYSSYTCYSFQKGKRAKLGNLINALFFWKSGSIG